MSEKRIHSCFKCGSTNTLLELGKRSIKSDSFEVELIFQGNHCNSCKTYNSPVPAPAQDERARVVHHRVRGDSLMDIQKAFERKGTDNKYDPDPDVFKTQVLGELFQPAVRLAIQYGVIELQVRAPRRPHSPEEQLKALGVEIERPTPQERDNYVGESFNRSYDLMKLYTEAYLEGCARLPDSTAPESNLLLLLLGPPGVGKTRSVELLASEKNRRLIKISGGDVLSKWQGESTQKIRNIFAAIKSLSEREDAPIVYFNEFDSISADPESPLMGMGYDAGSMNAEINRLVDEYRGLIFLDSNHPDRLRQSHRSRSIQIRFEKPSKSDCEKYLTRFWPKEIHLKKDEREEILTRLSGKSYREIHQIIYTIWLLARKNGSLKQDAFNQVDRQFELGKYAPEEQPGSPEWNISQLQKVEGGVANLQGSVGQLQTWKADMNSKLAPMLMKFEEIAEKSRKAQEKEHKNKK